MASSSRPRVVIVGGGFGGISAARSLARAPVDIVLVDRRNHYLFQPLLYQVATAWLTPGQIAAPLREMLRSQRNARVLLAEVVGIDPERRRVRLDAVESVEELAYDWLIVATGVRPSYFGRDDFAAHAPSLKSLEDATAVRALVLRAFEEAELEDDPALREEHLTFVLVGAGPTGCEMAGAIAEMSRLTLADEFRTIDPRRARIVLLEAGPRILSSFDAELARRAHARLLRMGVEIRTLAPVEAIDERGVRAQGERIASRTVLWTAGVKPVAVADWLGAETDRSGRVRVGPHLALAARPEIFVVGDAAYFEQDGKPLPGVAQVALQGGRHAARAIAALLDGAALPAPFRYRDKGNLSPIGRNFALLETPRMKTAGFFAFLVWIFVHLQYLPLPGNRLMVFVQWTWSYFTRRTSSRLILSESARERRA